jgi:hypothetical protein
MKKIFTLLVSVTMFASAFAQYKTGDMKDSRYNKGNDVAYNNGGFKKDDKRDAGFYAFSTRERDMQIAQINREYDHKIAEVKSRFFISRYKKDQMICQLNDQRNDEIKRVYAKFSDHDNHYNDHDSWRH